MIISIDEKMIELSTYLFKNLRKIRTEVNSLYTKDYLPQINNKYHNKLWNTGPTAITIKNKIGMPLSALLLNFKDLTNVIEGHEHINI